MPNDSQPVPPLTPPRVADHLALELLIEDLVRFIHVDAGEPGISAAEHGAAVLVAGGLCGWHSLYVPTLSWGIPITRAI